MLIWTARLSRKKAALGVILGGILFCALILFLGRPVEEVEKAELLSTNAQRIAYLASYGWEVAQEPVETLQFLLPESLEEPYLSYNVLQRSQGFDLSQSCGKQIYRYTYAVTNYPGRSDDVQVNLYLCEDLPVAGDVCCPGADGFRNPLARPEATDPAGS